MKPRALSRCTSQVRGLFLGRRRHSPCLFRFPRPISQSSPLPPAALVSPRPTRGPSILLARPFVNKSSHRRFSPLQVGDRARPLESPTPVSSRITKIFTRHSRTLVETLDGEESFAPENRSRVLMLVVDVQSPPQLLAIVRVGDCLLYTSPSPRDKRQSRMPSSA